MACSAARHRRILGDGPWRPEKNFGTARGQAVAKRRGNPKDDDDDGRGGPDWHPLLMSSDGMVLGLADGALFGPAPASRAQRPVSWPERSTTQPEADPGTENFERKDKGK